MFAESIFTFLVFRLYPCVKDGGGIDGVFMLDYVY